MKHLPATRVNLGTFGAICCLAAWAYADNVPRQPNQAALTEPYWQLFLDDHIITRSTGFDYRVNILLITKHRGKFYLGVVDIFENTRSRKALRPIDSHISGFFI